MALDIEPIKNAYLKLPDKQKILVPVIIMLVLGGLYAYLFYMPMLEEEKGLETKLSEMQTKLSQSKAVAANLKKFQEEVKVLQAKRSEALEKLPGSDEIPKLLKDMESIGIGTGVSFKSIVLKSDVVKGFYAEVPVELQLSSKYHDFAVFVDRLANLPRIITVSGISFTGPEKVAGEVVLKDVKCVATTYKFLNK